MSFLYRNYQELHVDHSSKQLESTESQQVSPPPSHSFVLKKKDRTPEEGSKAIYRSALIAAIGSTKARRSTANIPRADTNSPSLPFVSSPVKTEVPSPTSLDRTVVDINCSSIEPQNKSEDNGTVEEDQWSPVRVFEDAEAQRDSSEPQRDGRVSQPTPRNLSFLVVFFFIIYFICI